MSLTDRSASRPAAAHAFLTGVDAQTYQRYFSTNLFRGFFGKLVRGTSSSSFQRQRTRRLDQFVNTFPFIDSKTQHISLSEHGRKSASLFGGRHRFSLQEREKWGRIRSPRPGGRNIPFTACIKNKFFPPAALRHFPHPGRESSSSTHWDTGTTSYSVGVLRITTRESPALMI